MPLHLLGKKSWNVYNPANIARVKADEEAAAAREAAADQRTQELDAARRAAILRGQTPPPLPDEDNADHARRERDRDGGHDRKRRKLRGEDDTDMDIRLAASITKSGDGEEDATLLKLRRPTSDAPLTDHAGHIDLFPVDMKEALRREKNAEAEKEKRKKEQAFEDQYTMRFANAAGKNGLDSPWYTTQRSSRDTHNEGDAALEYPGLENKDAWGNEDPRRKEREQARISSSDPFAFMQKAQTQLKKSKEDKKRWADERKRDLKELRDAQHVEERRNKHQRRSSHRRSRTRSRSPDREHRHRHSHRRDRSRSRSRERERGERRDGRHRRPSSRHHRSRSPSRRRRGYHEGRHPD